MHVDLLLVLASAIVGFLVGLTGAGGGALMTPMLIFMFGVTPSAAISSDLVAAVVMRPVGSVVHLVRGTVNLPMVRWLATGSVPGALLGSYLLSASGESTSAQKEVEVVLGAALLLGALAMVARALLRRRGGNAVARADRAERVPVRPLPTAIVGFAGGVMVGLTSVGSGSLMMVLLLWLYPVLASSQLVGTDLVQAVPLTAAAALGQLIFGQVELAVTASVILGSVPAALVGSLLSSRAPDHLVRPVVTSVITLAGLKYVGMPNAGLGVAAGVLALAYLGWVVGRRSGAWSRWARPCGGTRRPAAPVATAVRPPAPPVVLSPLAVPTGPGSPSPSGASG